MEIITKWRLYVVNGGYIISHFQLIACDLEEIPSKTTQEYRRFRHWI